MFESPIPPEALEAAAKRILGGRRAVDKPSVCCRVCGSLSLDGVYSHEICTICDWHEDGNDDGGPTNCGPHYGVNFDEAKENFRLYLTSRRPTEGQRFLRSLPLRRFKEQFLALQQSLYEAARKGDSAESARVYRLLYDALKSISRARLPAMSVEQQRTPRNN